MSGSSTRPFQSQTHPNPYDTANNSGLVSPQPVLRVDNDPFTPSSGAQQHPRSSADFYAMDRQNYAYDSIDNQHNGYGDTSTEYNPHHYNPANQYPPGSPDLHSTHTGGLNDSTAFLNADARQTNNSRIFNNQEASYSNDKFIGADGPPSHMLRNKGYPVAAAAGLAGSSGKRGGAGRAGARSNRKRWLIGGGVVLLVVIAAGVAGGVIASRKSSSSSSSNNAGIASTDAGKGSGSNTVAAIQDSALRGGNGTVITMENGTTFTYTNNFGGYWVSTPFDDSARPNSWTPPLNQSWDYTNNKIWGVNIGGWLVTEPFIVPGLFEPYENDSSPAIDEYTLMQKYGDQAVARMTQHYETFITEEDFAQIAGAGLSWVRIGFPFWAVETIDGEPFVEGLAWKYFLKAITWCRKYGIRINLDLHAVPGSQNGWNHSGKFGGINFLNGTMGVVNAQRTLNYIRTLTEFINQPQYKNVIPMFSIINEPMGATIGNSTLREWYIEAYKVIRGITGTGAGNGPFITIHDAFVGLPAYAGFMAGADRVALDQHNYLAFDLPNNDSIQYDATKPCEYWAANYNRSNVEFGLSFSGEWSLAINDCGSYINNVGNGPRYDGTYIAPGTTTPRFKAAGTCGTWNDWRNWDQTRKLAYQQVAYAHMDATQNWFFWTWKIGNSIKTGLPVNPMWSMKLGLQQGYFPKDPRGYYGTCNRVVNTPGYNVLPMPTDLAFTAFPSPWMTGGAGAGTIAATQLAQYGQWPPVTVNGVPTATNLPRYTATGKPITLSASTPSAYPSAASTTISPGNGWANKNDTAGYYAPASACSYTLPYSGVYQPVPTAPCIS